MKTILITGINGFLGSHLAKGLRDDYNVIGLEYDTDNLFRIEKDKFRVYSSKNGICESIFVENKVDVIIHTATVYRIGGNSIQPLLDANVVLPTVLFDLAQKHGVELFINTDSFFSHSKNVGYEYLQEYTLSKQHALTWLKAIQRDCRLVNMVIYHMYGEHDSPAKFISYLLQKLKTNEDIDLTAGEQIRDFIYIQDVVSAFKAVIENDEKPAFSEYDVCTGKGISIKELAQLAKKIVGSSSTLHFGKLPYRHNEIMSAVGNNESLLNIGWKCKYSLEDGLREAIK